MSRDCVSRDYLLSIANKDGAYGYVSAHEIINAPSVNPQEPSGDLISRQAVLDLMQIKMGGKELYKAVYELPSVKPQEPKIGHWIWCGGSHKCSYCEEYTCFSHKELLKYCPNCSARMIESEDKTK